jgi:AcrR family transcriptional regulator
MSSSQTQKPAGAPVERILAVASDLFYRNGLRATGVNEVIGKSGVAKATFYSHFPSKDDLAEAYLEAAHREELAYLDRCLAAETKPLGRFLSVIASVRPWLIDHDFRGCPFINIASEVPDPNDRLRKVGRRLYERVRERVEALAEALIASDRNKYGHVDARKVSNEYMLIMAGALAMAEVYHDLAPAEHALIAVRRLVGA